MFPNVSSPGGPPADASLDPSSRALLREGGLVGPRTDRSPLPAREARAWDRVGQWQTTLRAAVDAGRGRHGSARLGLDTVREMRRALNALPHAVLTPADQALRDEAVWCLKLGLRDRVTRHHDLKPSRAASVRDALRMGEACMMTGPVLARRPRSDAELRALGRLTRWADTGRANPRRAALVAAIRAPEYRDGVPLVRWREAPAPDAASAPATATAPTPATAMAPLSLPPRTLLEQYFGATLVDLELSPTNLRADGSVDVDSPFFQWRTLRLQQLPGREELDGMPRNFESLDVRALDPALDWEDLAPLLPKLSRLLEIKVDGDQLMSEPPPEWQLDLGARRPRFIRLGAAAACEPAPPRSFAEFVQTLGDQLRAVSRDHVLAHMPRLNKVQKKINARPELARMALDIVRQESGPCVDANLGRLDQLEVLVKAGPLETMEELALFTLRKALTARAKQTVAHRDAHNPENLEVAAGLAWVVDHRLATLLDVSPTVSLPVYNVNARLAGVPGVVEDGRPVNDRAAADALIAAEVAEGFPTLVHLACWDAILVPMVQAMLEKDPEFKSRRDTIEAAFQLEYEAAAAAAADPMALAGEDAFQRKEKAIEDAGHARLVQALAPVLALLRREGVLPQTSSHSLRT